MSGVVAHLKKAKEAIDKKDWKEAKKNAALAIKADKQNYNACILFGLASKNIFGELLSKVPFPKKKKKEEKVDDSDNDSDSDEEKEEEEKYDEETQELIKQRDQNLIQAEQAYRKATQLAPNNPLGWKGLEDLYTLLPVETKRAELIEVYERLASAVALPKSCEFIEKLAELQAATGLHKAAAETMKRLTTKEAVSALSAAAATKTFERLARIADWTEAAANLERPTLDPVRDKTRSQLIRERELDSVYAYRRDLDDALAAVVDHAAQHPELRDRAVPYRVQAVQRMLRKQVIEGRGDVCDVFRRECLDLVTFADVGSYVPYEYALSTTDEDDAPLAGDDAAACAERFVQLYPQRPYAIAFAAILAERKEQGREALRARIGALTNALTLIGKSSITNAVLSSDYSLFAVPPLRAWCALVEARLGTEDFNGALADADSALRVLAQRAAAQPGRSFVGLRGRLLVARGRALVGVGREAQAAAVFAEVVERDPANRMAAEQLFGVYLKGGSYEAALRLCETRAARCPGDVWAAGSAGVALLHLNRLEEAAAQLEGTVAREDMSPAWHYWLGRVYWAMGGVKRAGKAHAHAQFMAAARLGTPTKDPCAAAAFAHLGEYYRVVERNAARAAQCYQKATALNVLDPVAGPQLAQLYSAQGKSDECAALCRRVTAADMRSPATVWAWAMLGAHQIRAARYEAAALSFLAALKHQPAQPKLWQLLAETYRLSGRYVAAQKAAYRTIEIAPSDPYSLYQVAAIELLLFQVEDAQEAFGRLLASHGKDSNAATLFRKGYVEASLLRAKKENILGRTVASVLSLEDALRVCKEAVSSEANGGKVPAALWKLYGDTCTEFLSFWDSPVVNDNGRIAALADTGLSAYRRAAAEVHTAPSLLGDCAINRYRKATSAHAPACLAEAEAFAREALAADAENPALWNVLGVILAETDSSRRRSQRCFTTALQYDPKSVPVLNNLGLLALRSGDLECAYKAFTQLQAVDYLSPHGWNGVGLVREAIGYATCAPVVALTAYEQAKDLGLPPAALPGLGVAALLSGDPTQAAVVLAKCVEHGATDPSVHHALALAYEARGLPDLALQAVDRAILLGRGGEEPERAGSECGTGYRLTLNRTSDTSAMLATKARILCAMHRFSDSVEAVSHSANRTIETDSIESYCLAKLGKYQEALAIAESVRGEGGEEGEEKTRDALLARAQVQRKAGKVDAAMGTLRTLTERYPEFVTGWISLAALMAEQGKDPLPTLFEAKRANPLCCEIELMTAVAYLRAGDAAAALTCAQKAPLYGVDDARAWMSSAYIALAIAESGNAPKGMDMGEVALVFLDSAGSCEGAEVLYALAYVAAKRKSGKGDEGKMDGLLKAMEYMERHLHVNPEDAFGWELLEAVSALVRSGATLGDAAAAVSTPWEYCVDAVKGPLMKRVPFPLKFI